MKSERAQKKRGMEGVYDSLNKCPDGMPTMFRQTRNENENVNLFEYETETSFKSLNSGVSGSSISGESSFSN